MHRLIGSPPLDLPLENWMELYDLTVAFEPDLVLEFGRGYGNSTCVFTEAANAVGFRVVSVGYDSEHAWERSAPLIEELTGVEWFAPLAVLQEDITELEFGPVLGGSRRTLVYWDAHGTDVAAAIFARVLPALPAENKIVIDDIWTTRERYGLEAVYHAGPLWSLFEELLPLWDYLNERSIDFQSGDRWVSFTARD